LSFESFKNAGFYLPLEFLSSPYFLNTLLLNFILLVTVLSVGSYGVNFGRAICFDISPRRYVRVKAKNRTQLELFHLFRKIFS